MRSRVLDLGDFEVEPLQRAADVGRIARRVRQLGYLLIGAVTDDERNPNLLRKRRRGEWK
ncbi:hypothetical protein ACVWZV_001847 [Bradyrhizobium sp. GM5.1]